MGANDSAPESILRSPTYICTNRLLGWHCRFQRWTTNPIVLFQTSLSYCTTAANCSERREAPVSCQKSLAPHMTFEPLVDFSCAHTWHK